MGSTGILSGATLVNGWEQGSALEAQGKFARKAADGNARLIELRAADEIRRGEEESLQFKKKIRKLQGAQRVAAAANGVDVGDGSALEAQAQTGEMGAIDALTIKNNAWKKAWGLNQEAANERFAGEYAQIAAKGTAAKTYAAAGLDAFRYAYPELGGSGKKKKENDFDSNKGRYLLNGGS